MVFALMVMGRKAQQKTQQEGLRGIGCFNINLIGLLLSGKIVKVPYLEIF
jgi:DNA topoisomerase VI subunit B